ncbi:MAG: ATP-binding protein [Gaiellaceae bacterium]
MGEADSSFKCKFASKHKLKFKDCDSPKKYKRPKRASALVQGPGDRRGRERRPHPGPRTSSGSSYSRRELARVVGRYARIELLVVDELGFIALPEGAAELVFQVISERNERVARVITTSQPFGEWTKVLTPDSPRPSSTASPRAHIIETSTESSRFRHGLQRRGHHAPKETRLILDRRHAPFSPLGLAFRAHLCADNGAPRTPMREDPTTQQQQQQHQLTQAGHFRLPFSAPCSGENAALAVEQNGFRAGRPHVESDHRLVRLNE